MRLDITGRHVDITAPLRQLIEKRFGRLERVLNDAAVSATITLTKEKYRLRTEIAVHTRGDHVLRGNGESSGVGGLGPPGNRQDRAAGADAQGQVERSQAQGRPGRPPGRRRTAGAGAGRRRGSSARGIRSSRCRSTTRRCASIGEGSVPGVPQRRHRSGQHPVPSQGRQSLADRAGLVSLLHERPPARRDLDPGCSISRQDRLAMNDASPPRSVTVGTVLRESERSRGARRRAARRRRPASTAASPFPTRRRPALRCPASTPTCRAARVLVFGESEVHYLETLTADDARAALRRVFSHPLPCLLVTGGATRRRRRSPKPTAPAFRCCARRRPRPTPIAKLSARPR